LRSFKFVKVLLLKGLKVLVIFLTFTLDIKVKADTVVKKIIGNVHLIRQNETIAPVLGHSYSGALTLSALDSSKINLNIGQVEAGIEQKSLLEINNDEEIELYRGKVFISHNSKSYIDENQKMFKIKTPHGDITSVKPELIIDVSKTKTQVSVISGKVNLLDRASQKSVELVAGSYTWIGELLASGSHSRGNIEAIDFTECIKNIRDLSLKSDSEVQALTDTLRPVMRSLVEKLAEKNQKEIDEDFQKFKIYQISAQDSDRKAEKSRLDLKRYYRQKTLGIPSDQLEN
jgi:hypothetical protein